MSPISTAVLGFGASAQIFHIPFILALPSHFKLSAIFERKATPEKSLAREVFPTVQVYSTLEEVLSDDSIELIVISTINDTHYDYCKAALLAGKHVICEKPMTPTSTEAFELATLAREKNLILAVYQNRRFDGDFLTLKKLISDGTFGELSSFESKYDRYKMEAAVKLWKEVNLPGSGCPYDLGSHLIDQLLHLFGPPASITGIVSNSRLIGALDVADSFIIHLHYPSSSERRLPLIATASASILSLAAPQLRFNVRGTISTFIKFGIDPQEDQLKAAGTGGVLQPDFGIEALELSGTLYKADNSTERVPTLPGRYIDWFINVAEVVRSGNRESLLVKPEEAALVIKIIELAIKSSNEGRTIKL